MHPISSKLFKKVTEPLVQKWFARRIRVSPDLCGAGLVRFEGPARPLRLGVSLIIATTKSYLPNRETADRAAWYPHIPCTPAPGGVDDEHIYRSRAEVA
jgi:hypothetical protein